MKLRIAIAAALAWLVLSAGAWAQDTTYVVKPGDTLMSISSQMLAGGAKDFRRLAAHNGLKDANAIAPGTTLRIPAAWLKRQASPVRVIAVAGEVKAGERLLKVGDSVLEGEELASGPGAYATLEFADRSVLRIRPASRVTVESHRSAPSQAEFETRLRLGAGEIEAAVTRQRRQDFRVRTPTANMAVRGTGFRARAAEAGTQVEVTEGRVGVSGDRGGEVAVNSGFGTLARKGEAPVKPVALLAAPDLSRISELQEQPVVRISFPPLAGATAYRFIAAQDRELRNVVVGTSMRGPLVRVVDLRDGEYFYAVRGVDALGLEGRDAVGRFRLKARPLPPIPQAPAGGTSQRPGPVEFAWEPGDEAATYRFQLSGEAGFGTLLMDRAGLAERRVLSGPLAPGRYYWRVSGVRADGDAGPFGEPQAITVQEPVPAQ